MSYNIMNKYIPYADRRRISINNRELIAHQSGFVEILPSIGKRGRRMPERKSYGNRMPNGYLYHSLDGSHVYTHRIIAHAFLGLKIGDRKAVVNHIDGNPLNNNASNLHVGAQQDNIRAFRRCRKDATSKYMGVSWHKKLKKWHSRIYCGGVTHLLGNYDNEIDAARAYDKKAVELGFSATRLNFQHEHKDTNVF